MVILSLKHLLFLCALFACGLLLRPAYGQEAIGNSDGKSEGQTNLSKVEASAERIQVSLSDSDHTPLEMKRVFQWSDPVLPEGDNLCLLYLHEGRPVASCKVFANRKAVVHTFVSMTDHRLVARIDGETIWSPPESELKFQRLASAVPADDARRRTIEMKSFARDFSVITGEDEAKRQQGVTDLRLLPTPLLRYAQNRNADDGVIDGAVFGFVVGKGNPQAFLVLEAFRDEKSETCWRYAFSRRTLAKLEAFHKQQEVWNVQFFPWSRMTQSAHFCKVNLPIRDQ